MNLSAVELLVRVAEATEGASEVPADTNAGPYVERVLSIVGLKKGQPWCAAQVANIGTKAFKKHWPLPLTGGCQVLFDWATKKGIVYDSPKVGDVFVIWHPEMKPAARFAHTGIIIGERLVSWKYPTSEGNTSGSGSREGWIVGHRERAFKPADRFIRWSELLPPELQ